MTKTTENTKAAAVDLTKDDLVECILRRTGGTKVEFGMHNRKKSVYHFLPLDPTDPESPHVAHVANDDHYDRLLDIQESYRAFNPDEEYVPPTEIHLPEHEDDYANDGLDDILMVDPEQVSNDWLNQFAQKHLNLTSRQKQGLADVATTQYGLEFDYQTSTATDIIRMILVERIKEERLASDNT